MIGNRRQLHVERVAGVEKSASSLRRGCWIAWALCRHFGNILRTACRLRHGIFSLRLDGPLAPGTSLDDRQGEGGLRESQSFDLITRMIEIDLKHVLARLAV